MDSWAVENGLTDGQGPKSKMIERSSIRHSVKEK